MSFFGELKRRNVVRVAIAYVIMAWLVLQVVDVVVPILDLPNWISRAILLFIAIGFVVSLFVAWAYELTPGGLIREKDVDRSQSITHVTGRKLDFIIIGVLAIALAFFALDRFVWHDHDEEPVAVTSNLEKSIAVIPFANRSADESDAYFVDGIHDDILTQLHKLSGIDKVISRTSVERYRNTDMSIPEIAAELGVATILEGGVQRAGDRVRITMQLIDAAKDEHLWAETYNAELTAANVFEIQSEISTAIATALQAALTDDEASDLTNLPTESLAAWEKYQLGKYVMRDRSLDELAKARKFFEEAIEMDENFALAYVGLADSINLFVVYSFSIVDGMSKEDQIQTLAEATAAAERALEINPRLGEAYAALGYAHFSLAAFPEFGSDSVLQSDAYYRQALELAPNYADLYRWYAQTIWQDPLNKPAAALSMAQRAVVLDPMLATNHQVLGNAYEINGQYREALTAAGRAREIVPTYLQPVEDTVGFLRRHSDYARAIIEGRRAVARDQFSAAILNWIAISYRQLGDRDQYRFWSGRALDADNPFFAREMAAFLALDDGDFDSAIEHSEAALGFWDNYWDGIHRLARIYAQEEQPEALLKLLEKHAPTILDRDSPEVWPQAVMLTAPAVWALRETGEEEHAARIIELGLDEARNGIRQAEWGYGMEIADIEIHAVQGNHRFALEALTQAIEDGYRNPEWLERSHFLDPLRSEPEFLAAMDVIRAEMVTQSAQLEEMERNGELPELPQ